MAETNLKLVASEAAAGGQGGVVVQPCTGALGAELLGIDLKAALADQERAEKARSFIYDQLLAHQVVFFRDQFLSASELSALGRLFGDIEEEPFIPVRSKESSDVHVMRGFEKGKAFGVTLGWHVDHSYLQVPTMGIMLHAIDVPEAGNDTVFANMAMAYDELSEESKEFFSKLTVIHDIAQYALRSGHVGLESAETIEQLAAMRRKMPQVEHPLVCTHPETGRKFLYVNPAWAFAVKGFSRPESDMVMNFLFNHVTQTQFQCRFHWKNGSLAFWDNRCVLHSPTTDRYGARKMQRLALAGDWRPS